MRLLGLDLMAYGPFRGASLDFSAPGLHVVLGRNEAGKSTTLRAITGLLYGIDARTPDAHLHKTTDLRIGGLLEDSEKNRVRVVRRKGNTSTLLDENGEPLDESVMKRLLAGVSRESFIHAFGLTHEALAAGAQALLEGRGDLGESLFDASVGGAGEVQRLVAELRAEAERIYKPRGTTLPLNDALKLFADAQRSVRERESKPEAFLAQERGLAEEIAEQETQLKVRGELVARRARFAAARRRAPLERRQQRAKERVAQLALTLEHVERIATLRDRFAAYRHAVEQVTALRAESDRLADLVAASVRRAGLEKDDAAGLRLDARTESRIEGLLHDRTRLLTAIETTRTDIARYERELARLAEPAKGSDAAVSPALLGALSAALDRARSLGDVEARLLTKRAQLERKRADLLERADSDGTLRDLLSRDGRDASAAKALEAFVALRVPRVESVERLEARFDDVVATIARIDDKLLELESEAARIEKQIAVRSGDFAPPSAANLQEARAARDAAWRALHRASDAERRAIEIEVEGLLREADAVADRMIREADRVTALAQLRSEATANVAQREKLAVERERADATRTKIEGELAALFADAGVVVPRGNAFGEMRAWLDRHARIGEDYAALRAEERELSDVETSGAAAKEDVRSALAAAGNTDAPPARLPELIAAGTHWLAAIDEARRTAVETTRAISKVKAELDERLASRERDAAALEDVSRRLAELVSPLGVPADASADEVSRSVKAVKELFANVDKRVDVDARARAFESTVRDFERDVSRAMSELAPDLAERELRDAAPMLFVRAQEAHDAIQELARASAELDAEDPVVLSDEERALDSEGLARALEELEAELDDVDGRIRKRDERIGGLRIGLEAMKAESNAAEAFAAAQLHLARIREHAERWCRVRLAEHVLSREIERYRQENQGPLLAASSVLFARLTLGSFSGIKAGFDDKDKACLRCVRPDGSEVDVVGLSDGTRDQLYLSLRLASLLRRAEALEPMPVILDDVLIQLDDQRATAALEQLADVSRKMQVLFFTHHARLVDLARVAVPASELTVHELGSGRAVAEATVSPP